LGCTGGYKIVFAKLPEDIPDEENSIEVEAFESVSTARS
jgi:hypothetical protein